MIKVILLMLALFLSACNSTPKQKLDGKKIMYEKCASCHNLDLPPKIYDGELAPPMMAVSFHVSRMIEASNESERVSKARAFVKDYVLEPSVKKAFCDKKSLQEYGLMPSQKGNISEDELNAVTEYMFSFYTQEKLSEVQSRLDAFNAMAEGKKIAIKNNCLTCHRMDKKIVGPSFVEIKTTYKKDIETIKNSIRDGSREKWKDSRGAVMPAFKKLSEKELEVLAQWILEQR